VNISKSWSELLAPLVNKQVCKNKSALLLLLIFHSENSQKIKPFIEIKKMKVGKKSLYEIFFFLQYTLATIDGTLLFNIFLQPPFAKITALSLLL